MIDKATVASITTAAIERIRRMRSDIGSQPVWNASIGSRSLRAVLLEFVEQSLLADAENLGGPRLVVLGVLQREFDQSALRLLHRIAEWDAQFAVFGDRRGRHYSRAVKSG